MSPMIQRGSRWVSPMPARLAAEARMRRAHAAHPREMADLFARLRYSQKSVQPSLMIVAYQYAVLRRPFLEVSGTSLERERRALLLWFAVMFAGVALGLAYIVMEMLEATAI